MYHVKAYDTEYNKTVQESTIKTRKRTSLIFCISFTSTLCSYKFLVHTNVNPGDDWEIFDQLSRSFRCTWAVQFFITWRVNIFSFIRLTHHLDFVFFSTKGIFYWSFNDVLKIMSARNSYKMAHAKLMRGSLNNWNRTSKEMLLYQKEISNSFKSMKIWKRHSKIFNVDLQISVILVSRYVIIFF